MAAGDTIQTKTAQASGGTFSLVFGSTTSASSLVAIFVYSSSSSGVSCNTSGFTKLTPVLPGRGEGTLWWHIGFVGTTVSFTAPASNPVTAVGFELAGSFVGTLDQSNTNSATSGTAHTSGSITPSSGDVVLVGGSGAWSNVTYSSPGTGWTIEAQSSQANSSVCIQKKVTTGGSSEQCSSTASGSTWWGSIIGSYVVAVAPSGKASYTKGLFVPGMTRKGGHGGF